MTKVKMRPLRLGGARKRMVRTQVGALCYRLREGRLEYLLVTSRGTGRWVIPKGWPMDGETPAAAACHEAWEEAGVTGKPVGNAIGVYSYVKPADRDALPRIVVVFPVRVKRLAETFPECRERRRKWLSPRKAAGRLAEPELRQILRDFVPPELRG
ncbi:NUDIX hydrolase [Psychromarinibacter sp. C21-152]|uniref:NUDIX hydrolase n=1 Tax=Psychromarinibacter sediminicola TaxID=3033385 RepID=A0AAE3T7P1_9RHOB|nr:NUDIX hydrolase [Psychromarinibacter sediminicola]MDF0600412.1 NUDIX hydrolase [Psychromarinibacter sediminicola]